MTDNFKVHEFWPTPVYENYISVKSSWLDFIQNGEYHRAKTNTSDSTNDRHILNSLPDLKDRLLFHVNMFAKEYLKVKNLQFYFLNSWILKHHQNDFARPHFHSNSLLSGVYYLQTENNSGVLEFLKKYDSQTVFPVAISPDFSEYNYTNSEALALKPKNGTLVIFPSTLIHQVGKNESEKIRYSLAFNIFCKGTLENDGFTLGLNNET
tara:strand:+ start:140 stop:766 length:627 start_codon:yes stop_codon:yes gene_type:complete